MSHISYSPAAQTVAAALRAAADAQGVVWISQGLVALLPLHPPSALAYALHQDRVWPRNFRQQTADGVREELAGGINIKIPDGARVGVPIETLLDWAERSTQKDGRVEVFEVDLAAALIEVGPALQHLGVQAAALVEVTRTREGPSSVPVASGADPKPTASASGVTQPSRSAAGITYPSALPSGRPRMAELIDLAGATQDALVKLISVSSITQRGRTTGVVTESVYVWEPLAPQHRDLLHQAEDALRRWVDSARAVVEAARGDLRAFDAARATLEHMVDRKEWANPVRDGMPPARN